MANSIITYEGDGSTTQYALNFTLGILNRAYVKCRVGTEVDGLGDPVYRTLEWVTDGLVNIQGAVPADGVPIVFTRTMPKNALLHNYSDGAAIVDGNLDQSNLQHIMSVHEFLDGRLEGGFVQDIDMNEYKIINLADGTDDGDAVNKAQLDAVEAIATEQNDAAAAQVALAVAARAGAETAETNAETAEVNAEAAEVGAEAAQVLAEAARDLAQNYAAALTGTSTTDLAIATGSKVFTTQSGKQWALGQRLRAASDDGTKIMDGEVTAYSSTSLTIDVDYTEGAGSHADWNISIVGERGATGATGTTGATGPAGSNGSNGTNGTDGRNSPGGRLTLTSGVAVTQNDVTAASTIYYTPWRHDRIDLYSGSAWVTHTFTERSMALSSLTSDLPYDVFIYNNAGTLTLERVAWTSTTARATALTTQDGILVKSGDATRRYLGTFHSTSTSQTEDSLSKRYLFNYYNRIEKALYAGMSGGSYTYTTATWRNRGGNTTLGQSRFAFICGVVEDRVKVINNTTSVNTTNQQQFSAVALNGTTSSEITGGYGVHALAAAASVVSQTNATPRLGWNFVQAMEYSVASGTTTWYDAGSGGVMTGNWAC